MSFKATKRLAVAALCLAAVALPAKADNLASNFTVAPQSWLGNVAQNIRLSPGVRLSCRLAILWGALYRSLSRPSVDWWRVPPAGCMSRF